MKSIDPQNLTNYSTHPAWDWWGFGNEEDDTELVGNEEDDTDLDPVNVDLLVISGTKPTKKILKKSTKLLPSDFIILSQLH